MTAAWDRRRHPSASGPAQTSFLRKLPLGNADKRAQPCLGRQQVVVARVESTLIHVVADGKKTARAVIQKLVVHLGALGRRVREALEFRDPGTRGAWSGTVRAGPRGNFAQGGNGRRACCESAFVADVIGSRHQPRGVVERILALTDERCGPHALPVRSHARCLVQNHCAQPALNQERRGFGKRRRVRCDGGRQHVLQSQRLGVIHRGRVLFQHQAQRVRETTEDVWRDDRRFAQREEPCRSVRRCPARFPLSTADT